MDLNRGEIYFIREQLQSGYSEFIKIGLVRERDGRSSADRTKEHQTGNPRPLVPIEVVPTVFVSEVETTLHREFANRRILPGEWFKLDDSQLSEAIARCNELAATNGAYIPIFEEAERLEREASSADLLAASDEAKVQWINHRRSTFANKHVNDVAGRYKAFLVSAKDRGVNVDDYVRISESAGRQTFDKALFRMNYPAIVNQFTVTETMLDSKFSITSVKGEDYSSDEQIANVMDKVSALSAAIDRGEDAKHALDEMHQHYIVLIGLQPALKKQVAIAEAAIKVLCGTHAGIENVCTWLRVEVDLTKTGWAAIKASHPTEHSECTRLGAPSTTVVLKKGFGSGSDSDEE